MDSVDNTPAATIVILVNRSGEQGGTADPILYDVLPLLLPDRFAALRPSVEATPASS